MKKILIIMVFLFSLSLFSCGHEHSYGSWSTYKSATCTSSGIQRRTCSCGEFEEKTVSSTGHKYGSWTIERQPTCTVDGIKSKKCSACGDEITETITASHSWQNATCTTPKKCSKCGETDGQELGHSDNGGICSRCGEKLSIDMKTKVGDPDVNSFFGFSYYKNSADGIKLCWQAENISGKTIKYYTITVYFYNSVDDPAASEITGKTSKTMKFVGPVNPSENLIIFNIVDYVPTCRKVLLGEITLEYMDGTVDTGWYGYYTTYHNSSLK